MQKKAFNKICCPLMRKALNKWNIEGVYLNNRPDMTNSVNIIFNGEIVKAFF